ncbi:MAG TPA: histidine kinase, partial [Cyanobacteria bacterium UBA11148]|nr:histidine kinase [Cyanobacteria bacterium UBA11148]
MNSNLAPTQQSRRISSPFYQKRMFILAIPVSCLATSLIAFGWLQFNTTKAEEWVQHTQQVRLETQRLLKNLLDAETEVRGYALIRDQEFLNRYESAIAEIPTSIQELSQLVTDNPLQSQRIQQIRALVNARVSTIQHNLELIYSLPQNVTLSPELVSQLIEGKRTMDRARVQIEQFLAEEERLQREREQRLIQHRKLTWLILSLSAIIGIIGSLLAAYLLSRLERNLAERDRRLRDSEARYRQLVELCPDGI